MLKRLNRLPSAAKLSPAHFLKTSDFSVKFARNGQENSRFAFVVKKSLDKRAVIRNRVRRVFRSCIEELLLQITPGYDMLFFLEKGIIVKKRTELLQELRSELEQRGLTTKQ